VNSLSRKRYVRRARPKRDRRQQLCYLTDSGNRLLTEVLPVFLASQTRVFKNLNQDERTDLVELLRRVTDLQT
jgi:DNA-binding MarR family transcriptional regulator